MPQVPTKLILSGLLNSHLAICNHRWAKVDLANPPANGPIHEELDIITKLALEIPVKNTKHGLNDWHEYDQLLTKYEDELFQKRAHANGATKGTLSFTYFKDYELSLLEKSIRAMRSVLATRIGSCYARAGYHESYFHHIIQRQDPHEGEQSFKDYCDSIMNGKRSENHLTKLLASNSINITRSDLNEDKRYCKSTSKSTM